MIKRYIPERYDFQGTDLFDAIQAVLGGETEITLKGRMIILKENPTPAQLQQIKTNVQAILEDVNSIDT